MSKRGVLFTILGVLIVAAVLQRLLSSGDEIPIPPSRTVAELTAAPDSDVEALVVNDLARQLLTRGLVPGRWKTMRAPAQAEWALHTVWSAISDFGPAEFLANHERQPSEPGLDDAVAACQAMGLDLPAKLFQMMGGKIDPESARKQVAQLRAALGSPAVLKRRVAYVREHLDDFPDPFRK